MLTSETKFSPDGPGLGPEGQNGDEGQEKFQISLKYSTNIFQKKHFAFSAEN